MAKKPIPLHPHLRVAELEQRSRRCADAREQTRWQAIWLDAQQMEANCPRARAVSEATGFSQHWVDTIIRRSNADGPRGLIDNHQVNPGGATRAILSVAEQQALAQALQDRPPDGGVWTAPKIARWVQEKTVKTMAAVTAWTELRRLGVALRRPRLPRAKRAEPEEQAAFQTTSRRSWPRVGSTIPTARSRCGRRTRRGAASRP